MRRLATALRTEYRKLVTTRMWWVLLATMAGYMAFTAAVLAVALTQGDGMTGMPTGGEESAPLDPVTLARTVYTLASTFGYVFPVVVGAMSVTGEFRHMTITPTLLADPGRTRLLVAKLLASLPIGLLFGVVGTVATAGAGAAALAALGEQTFLGDPEVLEVLGRSVLSLTLWAPIGVGFGAVLKNQVAAIVVLLAFTQFVEPVARWVLGAFDATRDLSRWFPGAAGEAVAGESFYSASGLVDLLDVVPGALTMLAYAVGLAVLGRFTTFRRDIT